MDAIPPAFRRQRLLDSCVIQLGRESVRERGRVGELERERERDFVCVFVCLCV